MDKKLDNLIDRAEHLITRLEAVLPDRNTPVDWSAIAWRWINLNGKGVLEALSHLHSVMLENIKFVDQQKSELVRNTRQFLQSLPANNVLLTGARGTGKSTLIKALLTDFSKDGLRMIEVEKHDLVNLPEIVNLIRNRSEKFIIFCDDLTFEADEIAYKALKVVLDGTLADTSDNLLVYATSNRKHLMPEYMADNLATKYGSSENRSDEIRPSDTIEEKTALSERFGLWLSFYAFDQEEYLSIAANWLNNFDLDFDEKARLAALDFSFTRGARSGRVAYQFAKDYAGKLKLHD